MTNKLTHCPKCGVARDRVHMDDCDSKRVTIDLWRCADLIEMEKRYDVLASHMAEMKNIADNGAEQPYTVKDIVENCLKELRELD